MCFLLDHQFCILGSWIALKDVSFSIFGVLWLVTLWYVLFQEVIIYFSLVILFIFSVHFFGSVELQGVC